MTRSVELSALDLRYESYRMRNPALEARLLASIAERGIEGALEGARPNPRWLPALLYQPLAFYCGFDSDATAEQMIASHPSICRLRPSQHDWNDLLRSHHA